MAVPAGPTEKRYTGNGVTKIFTIPFLLLATSDLDVFINGIEVVSGFTITGAGNPTSIITFAVAPADQADVYLQLNVPFERLNDYQENGDFLSSTVNRDFDRIWQALKQLLLGVSRALTLGKTDIDGSGNYQAKGNGITNLRDPVSGQDAVTKSWLVSYIESFASSVISTTSIPYDGGSLFDFLRFWNSRSVDSIADLRLLSASRNQKAVVYGYYAKGDGGGGYYYVDTTDTTSADNGGTIIVGADGARWKLSRTRTVSVRKFGARGVGTDDTVAMQAAINSGAKVVKWGPGSFGIGAAGLTILSNQDYIGAGLGQTELKMLVAPTLDMVFSNTRTNFNIRGIHFNGNGMLTAPGGNFPTLLPCVHLSAPSNHSVKYCKFSGFKTMGMLGNIARSGKWLHNEFDRGTADTYINHGLGISQGPAGTGADSYDMTVSHNKLTYCQISVNCSKSTIHDNRVSKWGFSAGINTQAQANCHTLIITYNDCSDSNQAYDASPYAPAGIENWAPNSIMKGNICSRNFGDGIDNGGANCIIQGNEGFDNKGYGLYNLYQDATFNASGTLADGNRFYDTRAGGARTQLAGYAEQAGGLTGIMFSNNPCTNNLGPNVYNCTDRQTAAQYDWIAVTPFQNSWVDYGGGTFGQVSYYKDTDGIVRLRGAIKSGAIPNIAFVLPPGFRPASTAYFQCVSNNAFGFVSITPGGSLSPQVGSNVYVSLDGISFRAA